MKKLLIRRIPLFFFSLAFLITILPAYAKASEAAKQNVISETIEYFEDGSYMTITVTEDIPATRGTLSSKSGSKDYVLTNKYGNELWRFTVHGTFSLNSGVSATCTAASYSISIANDAWENESASAYCSGNQAIGDATFIKKLLSITVESKSCHVILTCDSEGNLS